IEENGMSDMVGGVWFAGRSFLGLSKLLLGTDDYDEILELASKGKRNSVDTEVKDVIANDPNSPYGQFPPNLPIFSFGKVIDTDKKLSDLSREDLANSLVFSFAYNAFSQLALVAQTSKVSKLYMGGNFFRHELIRSEIVKTMRLFTGDAIAVNFVKTGHTGAIGAMISKPEDELKYLAFMQQAEQQPTQGASS
uniref:Glucokinase n=1 Tax=Macrostomum lignano TaxID=282301 RepID=A0A1I8GKH7_9PLAT